MKTYTYFDSKISKELTIKVGENAQENWDIISCSDQSDIWFHLYKNPSPHVVLCTENNKKIAKTSIKYAASLCKEYSKLSNLKNVKVVYTYIKNVKKSDTIGSVYTSNTTIICV
jgi:predicted ribosome quality control (RQC) complex YloA/Tae2 family protein